MKSVAILRQALSCRRYATSSLFTAHQRVLLLSPPATGKSRLIADQVESLVSSGTSADSVLIVNASERTQQILYHRLSALLGSTSASSLALFTPQTCAQAISEEFGIRVGRSVSDAALTNAAESVFLRSRLAQFPLGNLKPSGPVDKLVAALIRAFQQLGAAGVTPAQYIAWAKKHSGYHRDLAAVYHAFTEAKQQAGVMSRTDQVQLALQVMENDEVLKLLGSRFRHVFADDIQEYNLPQLQMVVKLAQQADSFILAGDDDTTTLGFLGAGLRAMRAALEELPSAIVGTLQSNHRSSQSLLTCARRLICNNANRMETLNGVSKQMVGSLKTTAEGPAVEHLHFSSDEDSLTHLERFAMQNPRSVIGVFTRSNRDASRIAEELSRRNISVVQVGGRRLFDQPVVRGILDMLAVACRCPPSGMTEDTLLLNVLATVYKVPAEQMVGIASYGSRQLAPTPVRALLETLTSKVSQAPSVNFPSDVARRVTHDIDVAASLLVSQTASAVISKLIASMDPVEGGAADSALLKQFAAYVQRLERSVDLQTAAQLIPHLMQLREAGEDLAVEEGSPTFGVNVMSMHAAVPFEFDHVFLANAMERKVPGYNFRPHEISPPNALVPFAVPTREQHIESERRLVYVAMTRARATFTFMTVGTSSPSRFIAEALGAAIPPRPHATPNPLVVTGRVVADVLSDTPLPVLPADDMSQQSTYLSFSRISTYKACPLRYQYRYILNMPEAPSVAGTRGSALHAALEVHGRALTEGKRVGLGDLVNQYATAWEQSATSASPPQIRSVPPSLAKFFTSETAESNAEVDADAVKDVSVGDDKVESTSAAVDDAAVAVSDADGSEQKKQQSVGSASLALTKPQAKLRQSIPEYDRGLDVLKTWYDREGSKSTAVPSKVEERFEVAVGGVPFVGVWDRVDVDEAGNVTITDYKSGASGTVSPAKVRESLQLRLYARAYEMKFGKRPALVRIKSIDTGAAVGFEPTDAELKSAEDECVKTYAAISAQQFEAKPSAYQCKICAFKAICPKAVVRK